MKDWTTIRNRYLRDALPVRLGGIAANLARMKSFSKHEKNYDVIESLITESKFFIEWTAHEAEIEAAAVLVELQIQLARWQYTLPRMWEDPIQRRTLAEQAQNWSTHILEMSGLLE